MEKEDLTPIFNAIEAEELAIEAVEVLSVDTPWDKLFQDMGMLTETNKDIQTVDNAVLGVQKTQLKDWVSKSFEKARLVYQESPFETQIIIVFTLLVGVSFILYLLMSLFNTLSNNIGHILPMDCYYFFVLIFVPIF